MDSVKVAQAGQKIIVALDVDSLEKAKPLVEGLAPYVWCFKVGLELLMTAGAPKVVELIQSFGGRVFLDGKFCDIPNTVGAASKVVANLGVTMFNVHASAGFEAMKAAVANKGQSFVLAVTILTSLNAKDLYDLGYPSAWPGVELWEHYGRYNLNGIAYLQPLVMRMAFCAQQAGCDGIICSPQELELLDRQNELVGLFKITPGVRPEWAAVGDQKRVMTPAEAIKAGATALVIGRPITKPPAEIGTPVDAAKKIAEEIAEVL